MRHPYTPVFRDFLTSSMWATDPATRCVWLWFLLMADPEGFVVGTVPGVAQQAGVTLEQAERAIALLESPDPYSSTPDLEGRRIVKVPRGWHIVNFVAYRERSKVEAEKARKRNWARNKRAEQLPLPFPSVDMSTDVDASSETIDAPKPKPKPKPDSSSSTVAEPTVDEPVESRSLVLKELPANMELPDDLAQEARAAGVENPGRWFDKLKEGPIGGDRGVLAHQLPNYLRRLFGSWRAWEETERAKDAQRQAAAASPKGFGGGRLPPVDIEPNAKQRAFAAKHGIDLTSIVKGILADDIIGTLGLGRAKEMLGERLTVAVKQKRFGQPVTGKLTPQQLAEWGPPPVGGAVPEVA